MFKKKIVRNHFFKKNIYHTTCMFDVHVHVYDKNIYTIYIKHCVNMNKNNLAHAINSSIKFILK